MRKFLLATASLLAIASPAFAQEIETPFGGVHGPFVARPYHRDWDRDNWRARRWHHEHEWRHHHDHHWDDDED